MKAVYGVFTAIFLRSIFIFSVYAEDFRVQPQGVLEVSLEGAESLSLPYNGSALIALGEDRRFFRGIELELSAPADWLPYRGSLAVSLYSDLVRLSAGGEDAGGLAGIAAGQILDLRGNRFFYDPLPGKLQTVYQIPLRPGHGLRNSPYAQVLSAQVPPSSFPILFRLSPAIKGIG
jgi:hypothetical protein